MYSTQINQIKTFTKDLFLQENFDFFLLCEAKIHTYFSCFLDGHILKEYYTEEEYINLGQPKLCTWKKLRPFCFSLIKGKKLPQKFQIVLQFPPQFWGKLFAESTNTQNLSGLYLTIRYEQEQLYCQSGISLLSFSLDRDLENTWDNYIQKFLNQWME
ncbi:hypothetical protein FACS189418_4510 [Clostridia bacterium]|nr:hypothetical protein FACS189418_4510 [Clostridia bacterium]